MKLLVLAGPTAIGKTDLSIDVALALGAEIISGDSVQIYKGFDIGSAKVLPHEMRGVPHHLIDERDPARGYTAADFQRQAKRAIDAITERHRLPFLVGGTGLYINGLLYDYDFAAIPEDPAFRREMEDRLACGDREALHAALCDLDPVAGARIKPMDDKRLIRALEVIHLTGKPYSEAQDMLEAYRHPRYEMAYFALTMDRARLYERINQRVDLMLEGGLIAEVESLLASGFDPNARSLQAIGYKEVISYLDGRVDYSTMVETLKRNTRRFAKRQFTWFRRDPNITWIDLDRMSREEAAAIIIARARAL